MRKIFDLELENLYHRIEKMGEMVNDAIDRSVTSFVDHDRELAQNVIVGDSAINEIEVRIEKDCFTIIALQQPVATDLRRVVAVMKAAADLERIADHAVSIARATIQVKGNKRILEVEERISRMAEVVQQMMRDAWQAYLNLDIDAARRIAVMDTNIDEYLEEVLYRATKGMQDEPEAVFGGMSYVLVAGYLERIGDYITNICERIVYVVTGRIEELN